MKDSVVRATLDGIFREDFLEKMTFTLKYEGKEAVKQMAGKRAFLQRNSRCKGPKLAVGLGHYGEERLSVWNRVGERKSGGQRADHTQPCKPHEGVRILS